jgi:hypothetical protein
LTPSARHHLGAIAAALLALALLSYASVQSAVMQLVMVSPLAAMPMCDAGRSGGEAMDGMAAPAVAPATASAAHHGRQGPDPSPNRPPACPYCAVASHAPVMAGVVAPPQVAVFVYAVYRIVTLQGARGPPVLQPRARGPPVQTLLS